MRDLVQFVPFSKYQNDEKKLADEVLAEIPKQMVEYYKFKNLSPSQILRLMPVDNQKGINNNGEYPSFEEIQKNNEINFANLPIDETIYINKK